MEPANGYLNHRGRSCPVGVTGKEETEPLLRDPPKAKREGRVILASLCFGPSNLLPKPSISQIHEDTRWQRSLHKLFAELALVVLIE